MIKLLRNLNGMSTMYVIAAILTTSFIATALLSLSHNEVISAADYSGMHTAAISAKSGLQASEVFFRDSSESTMILLNNFIAPEDGEEYTDDNKCWLFGDENNPVSLHNQQKYSSYIQWLDEENIVVQVCALGYGKSKSVCKAYGIYHLSGIDYEISQEMTSIHAIYLGGEGRNFDKPVNITGDAYFGGDVHFNGGADGSIIDGNFKTGTSANSSEFDGGVTFKGNAYFQTKLKVQNSLVFEKKAGFEKEIELNQDMEIYDDAYFNEDFNAVGGGKVDMHSYTAYHYGGITTSRFINANLVSNGGTIVGIPDSLDVPPGNEPALNLDISVIPTEKKFTPYDLGIPTNFNASDLNSIYSTAQSNGQLWGDFLVVEDYNGGLNMGGGTFNKKIIWILHKGMNMNGNLYTSGPNSNSLFYIDGGAIQGFGSSGLFRGFVYAEGGSITYQWGPGNDFQGSFHHKDGAGFQMNSGNTLNLSLNNDVLSEFGDLGIITGTEEVVNDTLDLIEAYITPTLHGIHY